jgi:monolysocardiolipin acyltransferase
MPERRGWPKFLPRTGAKVSVTFGESLTPRIQPLVDAWREIASKERGTLGVGGEWAKQGDSPEGEEQRLIRSKGILAGGKEEEMRIRITSALQDGLRELGEAVEGKEGRFERKEWSQSRAGVNL